MSLETSLTLDEMPSSPMESNQSVNCDPSQPPIMLWNVDATEKSAVYKDLGVSDLEGDKAPSRLPPPIRHHTTPIDNVTLTKQPVTPINSSAINLTTPSSTKAEDHIHNGTACSCKRRLLDEINSTDSFACLADEILLQIFKWLPLTKLSQCGRVCKRWLALVQDESLWRHINLASRQFLPGILGNILHRGPVAIKLSRSKIEEPVFEQSYGQKSKRPCKRNGKHSKHSSNTTTTKVQYLDLSASDVSTDALLEIINSCPPLRKLSLESCQVNVSVLASVGQNAETMEELNLCMCEGILDYGMMQLLDNVPNLTALNLAWTALSKQALETLCGSLPPGLEKLNLSGCKTTLENMIVEQILYKCPDLRELDVSDTTALSEAVYTSFLDHGKIQYLALNRCYSLHYGTFGQLAKLKSLRALDVFGLIPDSVYKSVTDLFPGVTFNEHPYSAIARPTIKKKDCIWGIKCYD